jgi:hypothetical protein
LTNAKLAFANEERLSRGKEARCGRLRPSVRNGVDTLDRTNSSAGVIVELAANSVVTIERSAPLRRCNDHFQKGIAMTVLTDALNGSTAMPSTISYTFVPGGRSFPDFGGEVTKIWNVYERRQVRKRSTRRNLRRRRVRPH